MRLTDFLRDLGQPVAYYPTLTDLTGGVTATLMLCQLAYWTGKQADPHGWIYKTQADWWAELRLSRYEQETARKALRERGFVHEERRGIPAKLYYRLDLDAVDAAWEALQTRMRESPIQASDNPAPMPAGNRQSITETTAETPTDPTAGMDELSRRRYWADQAR
jgi:hypothetical protein